MRNFSIAVLALVILAACQTRAKDQKVTNEAENDVAASIQQPEQDLEGLETAYFASGCFWCVEAIFESVRGVGEVVSGYAGGTTENPTYEAIGTGRTGHAEAVKVYYDPTVISYFELVQVFFGSHDPTSLNQQGPDRGTQYRSIAFYKTPEEMKTIESYIKALEDNKIFDRPIVTEVTSFTKFYDAEAYHQDYEKRNPNNPYVRNVSIPRINRFKSNFPNYLKPEAH